MHIIRTVLINYTWLQANELGVAEWELEYSFLEYYSTPDISSASLDTLLEEIRHVGMVVKA
jgi:hypothetical protein